MEPTAIEPTQTSTTTGTIPVLREHIVSTPDTCGGKPRIAGSRIQVKHVAIMHERQGMTPEAIVSEYRTSRLPTFMLLWPTTTTTASKSTQRLSPTANGTKSSERSNPRDSKTFSRSLALLQLVRGSSQIRRRRDRITPLHPLQSTAISSSSCSARPTKGDV
jgi:uncharacterized protein (DUF433 family)